MSMSIEDALIKIHNEDPTDFDGISRAGYNQHTRSAAIIGHLEEAAGNLENDPWNLGELLQDLFKSLSPEEIEKIDGLLQEPMAPKA